MGSSVQRLDLLERRTRLHFLPISLELWTMGHRPLLDAPKSGAGLNRTGQELPVEGERRLLTLVLRVEVRDSMLAVEHADDDTKKTEMIGTVGSVPPPTRRGTGFRMSPPCADP